MTPTYRSAIRLRTGVGAAAFLLAQASLVAAQTGTLGDMLARVRAADSIANYKVKNPAVHDRILKLEQYVHDQGAAGMNRQELSAAYLDRHPGYAAILRWSPGGPRVEPGIRDSLVSIRRVASRPLRNDVERAIGAATSDTLYKPLDDWYRGMLDTVIVTNGEILKKYAVKYGPGSPHLNLAEAALNYLAQLPSGSPFAGGDDGPSPLEIVASYKTTDLTASKALTDSSMKMRIVTSAQLGLRVYRFAPGCGEGNQIEKLLKPCHYSFGAFLMGPQDTPLGKLWQGATRKGLYLAASNYHVGYVFGHEQRLVFGIDTQVLPYVF